jgi:branched-subunit amino acid transport protein
MSAAWPAVIVVGAATIALKGLGPAILGGRELPRAVAGPVALLAPAVLAALVIVETFGATRSLVVDARLAGVTAGAAAIALRAPIYVVVVVAAAVTAALRALT